MNKIFYTTKGTYRQVNANYGIVTDDKQEEFFIFKRDRSDSLSGDLVEIKIKKLSTEGKKAEAIVSKILERSKEEIVCVFMKNKKQDFAFARPYNAWGGKDIYIYSEDINGAENDDIVTVKIKKGLDRPVGRVVSVIGKKSENDIQERVLLIENKIRTVFNEKVLNEAKNLKQVHMQKGRIDLTKEIIVTIDGADAKDLDDAISVKKNQDGNFELGVHIADVAEYVKEGTSLDHEALKRGTSIYLPGQVIPMLPKELSDDLCSLNPKTPKAALSIFMTIDGKSGKVLSKKISETLIHTTGRLTYDEVWDFLQTKDPEIFKNANIDRLISDANELFRILYSRRLREGKIEFEFAEVKVVVDQNGKPVKIEKRDRNDAHRLIEEFMIIANEEISRFFSEKKIPFLYRVHEKPSMESMVELSRVLMEYSINLEVNNISPLLISQIIRSLKGKKEEYLLSKQILIAMSKAKYLDEALGHFGLSLRYYSHFTSPIRRYPDLQIHRIIKKFLHSELNKSEILRFRQHLKKVADSSSKNEQKAEEVERKISFLKTIEFMSNYIGEKFIGRISGLNMNGLYVELENGVEGFVMAKKGETELNYDPDKGIYFNNKKKISLGLGTQVEIKVTKADKQSGFLDFELI